MISAAFIHPTCRKVTRTPLTAPSARSGDLPGNGQMLVMRTTEDPANPLGKLISAQQTVGLDHLALAMDPLRLYGVQPRALLGQKAAYDPHSFSPLLLTSRLCLPSQRLSSLEVCQLLAL